jgi:hypothetical protein
MRMGGNGIFGSISNKRRKRLLSNDTSTGKIKRRMVLSEMQVGGKKCGLEIPRDGVCDSGHVAPERYADRRRLEHEPRIDDESTVKYENSHANIAISSDEEIQTRVGAVIESLHEMWTDYIRRLLISTATNGETGDVVIAKNRDMASSQHHSNVSNYRRGISHLLARSEHVGMPATIVYCPSRRHLIDTRCVVVDETRETWKVAMMVKGGGGRKNDADDKTTSKSPTKSWKIVMVPKRGTAMEVDVPLCDAPDSNGRDVTASEPRKNRITIRIEN